MFDTIRNNTRFFGFLLALFIIPAFVLVGVEGYRQTDGRGNTVAVVAGTAIKSDEWDAEHRREVDRIRARQPDIDVRMLDTEEARYATLERLVRERLLVVAAQKMNLVTTDQKLARDLQQDETIASLRKPDGTLDMDRYRQLLAAQGLSPEGFEAQVRRDLSQRQVAQGVMATALVTPAAGRASLDAFFERRTVQWLRFDAAAYRSRVTVSDADVEAHYQANAAKFQAPEQADVEFLVLDMDAVMAALAVSDAEVKAYFEQNASRYSTPEERRASHILINAPKDAPAAERQAAKDKAQALLDEVRKTPARFADVAKKSSQDTGSAASGGDLSFFSRGAMVKPFEDAVFALKKGDISDLVESEFGFHIIQLTDIRPAAQRPLEQVKADIVADIKKQKAQPLFAEKAELLGNLVYEQPDSLTPAAERLGLKVQSAQNIQRTPQPGGPQALANEKVLDALFSAESIDKKRNTEAIETGSNRLVAARVVAHRPAHTLPLKDVAERVKAQLVGDKAQALAREAGEAALAAWKGGTAPAGVQPAVTVSRDRPSVLGPKEVAAAMKLDVSALPAWGGVDLGRQGYAVLKVTGVQPREAAAPELAAQELRQYEQWWTSAEGAAYYEHLKQRFKVDIKVPRPASKSATNG